MRGRVTLAQWNDTPEATKARELRDRFLVVVVGLLMILAVAMSGCTSETRYGSCVGVDDERDPALIYKPKISNIVVGAIFIETVVVPLVVLFSELECPVAARTSK